MPWHNGSFVALPEPFLCCFRPSASAVSSCADETAVSASADESGVAASADESGVAAIADESAAAIAHGHENNEADCERRLLTVMTVTVKIGIINDTNEGDGDDHHEDDDERRGWRVNYNDGEGGRCSDNQYENDVDDGN